MMSKLQVSVVMSVFDKPAAVKSTVESVLCQQGVDLELIIVDDGASTEVLAVLDAIDDGRVFVHHQANQGLTLALVQGCKLAKYDFIARIDVGDTMLVGRLAKQAAFLRRHPDAVLVACWVQMHTQDGYDLYQVKQVERDLQHGALATRVTDFKSPVHASVMFRTSSYRHVGGYRSEFYFAQDCDLWARLAQHGRMAVIEEVLQAAVFSADGISGKNSGSQRRLAKLVCELNNAREQGRPEEVVLQKASQIRPKAVPTKPLNSEFEGNYFIASVLTKEQPKAALVYWRKALVEQPWHMVGRLKQAYCWLRNLANQ